MKRILKMTFLGTSLVIAISACNTEEPETYWYSYGTYIDSATMANGFIVDLDNGSTLIPTEVDYIQSGVKDSTRIVVSYSIVSEQDSTVNAKSVEITSILTKDIIQLTEENKDSIGNDEVQLQDDNIWFSENHLNIIFGFYGGGNSHSINLAKPIGEQLDENGRQILEFKHNKNDDPYNYWYTGIVSFDMRSLYSTGIDSINIVLNSTDFNNGTYSWEGTYHFKNQTLKKATKMGIPKSSILVQ